MSYDDFLNQESGGGIDKYTINVTNAFFAVDEAYSAKVGSDTYFLHWEGTTDVPNHETMTRDGFHPKWALDPDFLSMDGGKTVRSQSGKGKLGKAVGRMMSSAANAVKEAGVGESDPANPFASGDPKDASVWIGTTWYVEEVTRDFGNGMSSTDAMPTKFIPGGAAPAAAAPTATAAAAPAAPAAPAGDLRAQVVALAQTAADQPSFTAAALAIPGVSGDPALVAEIVDVNGIFAKKA